MIAKTYQYALMNPITSKTAIIVPHPEPFELVPFLPDMKSNAPSFVFPIITHYVEKWKEKKEPRTALFI